MATQQKGHIKPVISKTPADIGNPQVNWDRKKFDDAIFDKGYKCYIERSMRCPCSNEANGQADSDCKNCIGTGWFFVEKTESHILCTSISNRSKYEQWSESNSGIVNISCRAQDKLGFMDKVTLIELESWFSQVIQLRNSISEPENVFSFLIYNPISVFDVFLFVDAQSPLISLKPTQYKIDYNKIVIEKSLLNEMGVNEKSRISIRYTHYPVYHIIDINRDLIKQKNLSMCSTTEDNKVNFPLSCIGRRAHYILDNPNYNGTGVFDNTDYTKKNNYDI